MSTLTILRRPVWASSARISVVSLAALARLGQILVLPGIVILAAAVSQPGVAAPEPWNFWLDSDESNSATIDHSPWQNLLGTHVHLDQTGLALFDYRSAKKSDTATLDAYLANMQKLDPRDFNRAEQKAYWLNMYNALTVKLILDNYPVESITKLGERLFSFGPWDDLVAGIAGQELSLNDIEHRILRPLWPDARIHFGVNCASIGCPNIPSTAFTASNTDEVLSQAAQDYLVHPRAAAFDQRGNLLLSSIFDWYSEDFGANRQEVLIKLSTYAPAVLSEKLKTFTGKISYDYDWRLNDFVADTEK